MKFTSTAAAVSILLASALVLIPDRASGQLLENLKALGERIGVGDPETPSHWEGGKEGPKGIASGDLDGDGRKDAAVSNLDGSISVLLAGANGLSLARHLRTGAVTLRDILIADLNGDGRDDIAATAPLEGTIFLFAQKGGGEFELPIIIPTWPGARNLAAGDFDGDGQLELVVAGNGKGLQHLRRDAQGVYQPIATLEQFAAYAAPAGDAAGEQFLEIKPVYSLKVFRPLGSARDELLVTHAEASGVCLLAAGAGGALEVKSCIPILDGSSGTYAIEACPVTEPSAAGRADLITVHRDLGTIQIRKGSDGPERFAAAIHQEIAIPGGPRSIALADLDGDGWNDLAVVLRNFDRVLTYRNDHGLLVPSREMPVGMSPRELVPGDFNGDGQLDFAVINRLSGDVSVLPGVPGEVGFGSLDQIYLVDGQVAALELRDFNGDGRADVIQLHQASGDVSVRLARPDGSLAPPEFYTVGDIPADLKVQDINNDGHNDLVGVSLGRKGLTPGSVSVRLGKADGSFGPEQLYQLPPDFNAGFFSLLVADLDGDGTPDLVTGYTDCRVSFFRGTGDGRFIPAGDHDHIFFQFGYEIRAMAVGDFDQDGDLDLAGAAMNGEYIVVAENPGSLLDAKSLNLHRFGPSSMAGWVDLFPTLSMVAADVNRDGDLDLIVGTGAGAFVFQGGPGVQFTALDDPLPGTVKLPTSSITRGDLDGDGDEEIIVSCKVLSCIIVLTRDEKGNYVPAQVINVPSGQFVAMGDIDGDRHLDLAGTGSVLWTALSSRRAKPSDPPILEDSRHRLSHLVINEILAVNTAIPLPQNGGKRSDWIEIFNGADREESLAGYRLVLETPAEPQRSYVFPAEGRLASGSHLLLVASSGATPNHLGFKIPSGGGLLQLLDVDGAVVDSVPYGPQRENVSYARYHDGLPSFTFNPHPSPARTNFDNGAVEPLAHMLAVVGEDLGPDDPPRPIRPGEAIRFYAEGKDDVFLVNLSVLLRRLDFPQAPVQRITLYDDGLNADGASQDGLFSAVLFDGLPAGGAFQFYLEGTDLSGTTIVVPDGAFFTSRPEPGQMYSLAVGAKLPRLEISEFVARNSSGLRDEAGQTADWVEIRNCSEEPAPLAGFFLADRFPANEEWLALPEEKTLAPGESLVLFADGNPAQGPLHAPFRMGGEGGQLFLLGRTAEGAHQVVDAVGYAAQAPDVAWGRSRCGGGWTSLLPTPGLPNPDGASALRGDVDRSGRLNLTDAVVILLGLFQGLAVPCPPAMDVNRDSANDVADAITLLAYLFQGGPPPAAETVACE